MTFAVGTTVHITPADSEKYAGTYKITKVNPTTYRLSNDKIVNLKAPHSFVKAGELSGRKVVPVGGGIVEFEPPVTLQPGTVVTLNGVRGVDATALWVVTGSVPKGYRVFPLGGSTRYYTGLPAARLTVVKTIDGWQAP